MKKPAKDWLFALFLLVPMLLFFTGYLFNHAQGLRPTGFIQYDNVSYIAYAKQYLDGGHSGILYSNPFNDSGLYPSIYFQPQTILFAAALAAGMEPGMILLAFTILCSLACFRIIIAIVDQLYPRSRYRFITILLFAWGGGLLVLAGLLLRIMDPAVHSVFHLDPGMGWWGLNLGRSLFFSCEAYYHLLFLATILAVLKRKWVAAWMLLAILSTSHPFTGIELIVIMLVWVLGERLLFRNREVPVWFVAGTAALLALHVYYYLFYLPSFPDHRSVQTQYALNWRLRFFSMIPAYCLAGLLVAITLVRSRAAALFKHAGNRLFLAWLLTAFALANHEWVIEPMQPLHFTRGYIWTALFLLGIPGLHYLLDVFRKKRIYAPAGALFLLLFLSDNLAWIGMQAAGQADESSTGHTSEEERELLQAITHNSDEHTLIAGRGHLPYLATVYSGAYPWVSHPFTTPFAAIKEKALDLFLNTGVTDSTWKGRNIIVVLRRGDALFTAYPGVEQGHAELLAETKNYRLVGLRVARH